jgi:hypothetical protein
MCWDLISGLSLKNIAMDGQGRYVCQISLQNMVKKAKSESFPRFSYREVSGKGPGDQLT